MNRFAFILLIFFASAACAQFAPQSIHLSQGDRLDEAPPEPRLASNVIIDILPSVSASGDLWLATGGGVTHMIADPLILPHGYAFRSYGTAQGLGKGGVSGLLVTDSIIWASFAFDTSVGISGAGGGLAYSRDQGLSWIWLPQPRDRMYNTDANGFDHVLGYWPTTTNVDNITYDIAISDSFVWIVSKGGGIRRHIICPEDSCYVNYDDTTGWQVIDTLHFTDGRQLPFHPGDPVDGLYHRTFSVLYDEIEHALWVGTAAGLLKSTNEGRTWKSYSASSAPNTISGNFVTALDYQPYDSSVWAATWRAESPQERYAVSKSTDGGLTWRVYLDSAQVTRAIGRFEVVRAHSFAFDGPVVYVCDDIGLWVSPDNGETWDMLTEDRIFEAGTERRFYYTGIYSALNDGARLWVGGVDGLAFTDNGGVSWSVLQTALPLNSPARDVETYAYPNPFSPERFDFVKFRYSTSGGAVKITIYDFAMSKVVELPAVTRSPGEHYEVWDGRKNGTIVANGTYFYKIEKPGGEVWGKVIVLD
ncbi:hypothetical protein KKH27_12905 [bacterium]|nr:hypothetical protein [bacterium]MBU1983645.1 hypothetical protein [bacterium]